MSMAGRKTLQNESQLPDHRNNYENDGSAIQYSITCDWNADFQL